LPRSAVEGHYRSYGRLARLYAATKNVRLLAEAETIVAAAIRYLAPYGGKHSGARVIRA
jgi:hypothetical protein